MKVKVMSEPEFSFLVTGCDDIEKARAAVIAEYESDIEDQTISGSIDEWFNCHPGRVEVGHIFNCGDNDPLGAGCAWYWMTGNPGRGRFKAVIFDSRTA